MTDKRSVPPPQLHFDDGSRIMAAPVKPLSSSSSPRGNVSIETYYEVDRLSNKIKKMIANNNNTHEKDSFSCRVALQFPDELLVDAPNVCWAMQNALGEHERALVFVLGDSTFGSCCCDEVSALHLDATVLIHYGHACLSPTLSLPVLYSFGVTNFNVRACVNAVLKQQQRVENILLLYEVRYHHAMNELARELRERGAMNVVMGRIPQPQLHCSIHDDDDDDDKTNEHETTTTTIETESSDKFVVGGLELPSNIDLESYTLLFVGDDNTKSRQYVNVMLRFLSMPSGGPSQYWTYSPSTQTLETSLPPFLQRQLNRRFYLTQKARDASVYGILVGTTSQKHFSCVVSTIQRIIQNAGKSCYTFAVGKINGAKLANFAEIECYVLVACGENSLLDNERDLHVPVITPLELDIALGNSKWGNYSLDYNDFLSQQTTTTTTIERVSTSNNDDAPYYSLVSGTYVDSKAPALNLEALPGRGQLAAYKSEASNYLQKRQYQGLQTNIGKNEVHAAQPGQAGIASNYGNR